MRQTLSRLMFSVSAALLGTAGVVMMSVRCMPEPLPSPQEVQPEDTSSAVVSGLFRLCAGDTVRIARGGSVTLSAAFAPDGGEESPVAALWSSSPKGVVSVGYLADSLGVSVTGLSDDKTVLRVTWRQYEDSCVVYSGRIEPETVRINLPDTLLMTVGEAVDATASAGPSGASTDRWIWAVRSSSPVVAVAYDGPSARLTAVAEGDALLTVRAGSAVAQCLIRAGKRPDDELRELSLSESSLRMPAEAARTLEASPNPANAQVSDWRWSVSDGNVLSVTGDGPSATVTSIRPGRASVSVEAGGHAATCEVTVSLDAVRDFTLIPSSETVEAGSTCTVSAHTKPSDAVVASWNWWCADGEIAEVSGDGPEAVVRALKEGSAAICAKADGLVRTVSIAVTPEFISPESLSAVPSSVEMEKGSRQTVTLSASPSGATIDHREVRWTSDDPSVALVESNGDIYSIIGIDTGTTTLRASCGGLGAEVAVKVVSSPSSITLSPSSVSLYEGCEAEVHADVLPAGVVLPAGSWTVSDEGVFSVSEVSSNRATLRGVGAGSARLTAGSAAVTASVPVTVLRPVGSVAFLEAHLDLILGRTDTLSPVITPAGAHCESVVWESSAPGVLFVEQDGTVKALGEGEATVTCRVRSLAEHSASVSVTVMPEAVDPGIGFSVADVYDGQTPELIMTFPGAPVQEGLTLELSLDGTPLSSLRQPRWEAGGTQSVSLPAQPLGGHEAEASVRDSYGRVLESARLSFTVHVVPTVSFRMKKGPEYAVSYGTSSSVCVTKGSTVFVEPVVSGAYDGLSVTFPSGGVASAEPYGADRFYVSGRTMGEGSFDMTFTMNGASVTVPCGVVVYGEVQMTPYLSRNGFNRSSFALGLEFGSVPFYGLKGSVSCVFLVYLALSDGSVLRWTTDSVSASDVSVGQGSRVSWGVEAFVSDATDKLSALGKGVSDILSANITEVCEWTFSNSLADVVYGKSEDSRLAIYVDGTGSVSGLNATVSEYKNYK